MRLFRIVLFPASEAQAMTKAKSEIKIGKTGAKTKRMSETKTIEEQAETKSEAETKTIEAEAAALVPFLLALNLVKALTKVTKTIKEKVAAVVVEATSQKLSSIRQSSRGRGKCVRS